MSWKNAAAQRDNVGITALATLCALALSAGGAFALGGDNGLAARRQAPPAAPTIIDKPLRYTDLRWALFTFHAKQKDASFECSLDGSRFARCPNRVVYGLIEGRLATGSQRCTRASGGSAAGGRSGKARRRPSRCAGARRSGRRLRSERRTRSKRGARRSVLACPQQPATRARRAAKSGAAKRAGRARARRCTRAIILGAGRALAFGSHTFRLRAKLRGGRVSTPRSYTWTILTRAQLEAREHGAAPSGRGSSGSGSTTSPGSGGGTEVSEGGESSAPIVRARGFEISGSPAGRLFPGGPELQIPLAVFNPNPAPIRVVSLTVAVASSPPGCSAQENLKITQSDISPALPLRIAAGETVTLPAQGVSAPTIQFLNLPVNQDSCQNATFPLSYTGSAST
ncbi:MAG TPA: hypothetical protein VKU89_10530 [Solirubrobacteraceae bacterium]|nr:hypothetical protein [Solirubrobacteraceae bacterium]